MIGADMEIATFDKMSEMLDCQVHSKELSVECFWWHQLFGKGDWAPNSIDELLKNLRLLRLQNQMRR